MTSPENYVFDKSAIGNYPPGVSDWAALQTPLRVQKFTDPAAASANAIKTAIASSTSAVTYSGAQLDGSIGSGVISPPRNITVTTAGSTASDAPATATITGKAIDGSTLTETINVAQTATSAVGVKCFAQVTSIALSAGDGTGATLTFGTGLVMGLDSKLADLGVAAAAVLKEVAAGSVVTTGTFVLPATSPPFGSYSPSSAPNGSNDYAVLYVVGS